jgi:hypothetical protein
LIASALLALAPPAPADYDPIGSGVTTLKLDPGFLSLLRENSVKISARGSATFKNGTLSFSVADGKFDPTIGKGTVEHNGSVLFKGRAGAVSFKDLLLKTTRRIAPISIKLGGGQLKIGTAKRLEIAREGFGTRVTVSQLELSTKVAMRLSKRLDLRGVFTAGVPLGSAVTKARPQAITVLNKGTASIDLDPAIAAKLNALHVAVNPIFPGEHPGGFTFEIFAGKIATDLSSGSVETRGGIEFIQLGGGQVIWSNAVIDLSGQAYDPLLDVEPAPPYAGKVGRVAVATLALGGASAVESDSRARILTLSGAPIALAASTAATFNETFAKPQGNDNVFAAGDPLGRISFLAQAQ